jgi:hypothetical protein
VTSKSVRVCCAAIFFAWRMATQFRALIRWERWPARWKFRCTGSSQTTSIIKKPDIPISNGEPAYNKKQDAQLRPFAKRSREWTTRTRGFCFIWLQRWRTELSQTEFQFDQSFLGRAARRVSFTKQVSHTRVPSLSVKSTRRVASISAPHFPQTSI